MEIKYYNKKRGLIFSLDAAIAVTVVVIILISSAYYLSTASRESTSQIQLIRIGNDLLATLLYFGDLRSVIEADTQTSYPNLDQYINVSRYLPKSYNATIEISDLRETAINNIAPGVNCIDPLFCCTATSCNGTFNLTTLPLSRSGEFLVLINVSSIYTNNTNYTTLNIEKPNGNIGAFHSLNDGRYVSVKTSQFSFGINNLKLNITNMSVSWLKVLGDKAYAVNTSIPVPDNTFVGTGERIFTFFKGQNIDQPRYVKFYIWIT